MLTIAIIAAATITANLAVVLTALEARRMPAAASMRMGMLTGLAKRPLWRLAALLDLSGWLLKTLALLVAPLTVVAPGMALGLFLLVAFSAVSLGEPVRGQSLIGIGLLAGGVALVAAHSPDREVSIAGPVPWSIVIVVLLGGSLVAFWAGRIGRRVDVRVVALSVGFAWALNGVLSKLMADALDAGRWALLGAALVGAFAVGALGYLSKTSALQSGEATMVESVVAVVNTLVPVALAPVLFSEEWPTDAGAAVQLTLGLAMVGAGVWLLTRTSSAALAEVRRPAGERVPPPSTA